MRFKLLLTQYTWKQYLTMTYAAKNDNKKFMFMKGVVFMIVK